MKPDANPSLVPPPCTRRPVQLCGQERAAALTQMPVQMPVPDPAWPLLLSDPHAVACALSPSALPSSRGLAGPLLLHGAPRVTLQTRSPRRSRPRRPSSDVTATLTPCTRWPWLRLTSPTSSPPSSHCRLVSQLHVAARLASPLAGLTPARHAGCTSGLRALLPQCPPPSLPTSSWSLFLSLPQKGLSRRPALPPTLCPLFCFTCLKMQRSV